MNQMLSSALKENSSCTSDLFSIQLKMKAFVSVVAAIVILLAIPAYISTASVIGFLGNFDVINDTGQTAYGFEIELEGPHEYEITDVFGGPGRGFPTGRGFDPATSVERWIVDSAELRT
jgi:hypothetical protein